MIECCIDKTKSSDRRCDLCPLIRVKSAWAWKMDDLEEPSVLLSPNGYLARGFHDDSLWSETNQKWLILGEKENTAQFFNSQISYEEKTMRLVGLSFFELKLFNHRWRTVTFQRNVEDTKSRKRENPMRKDDEIVVDKLNYSCRVLQC